MKKLKLLPIICITAGLSVTMCGTAFAGRTLSNGMSGDDVYMLQSMLAAYGYFSDEPTGYFGDMTESAVFDFQYDYGLEADGVAGPATCSYLGIEAYDDSDSYDYEESSDQHDTYSYGSLSRTLYNGMEGDDVYTLQVLLAEYGYFYGEASGYFGDMTESAVASFQNDYGLEADGVAGSDTIAMLTGEYVEDSSASHGYSADYASAIVNAAYSTPATGAGYCAAWVTQVLKNAGVLTYNINNLRPSYYSYAVTSGLADSWYSDSTGFNANDYWAYVCYSSDVNDLQPGMIVATRSSYTYLGRQFGHVGIYVGDGLVVSSVGYIETLNLDEWNNRYNNTGAGSSIAWGYLPS